LKPILIILFTISSFAQQDSLSLLDTAFRKNSSTVMLRFLEAWSADSRPDTSSTDNLQLRTEVSLIYRVFYKPRDYDTLQRGVQPGTLSKRFYLIQNQQKVVLFDNTRFVNAYSNRLERMLQKAETVTLSDFRPALMFDSASVLYLDSKHKDALRLFLESQFDSDSNIQTVDFQRNPAVMDKAKFLSRFFRLYISHWGDHWLIETPPFVSSIFMDRQCTTAQVHYRVHLLFGTATLKKQNRRWILMNNRIEDILE